MLLSVITLYYSVLLSVTQCFLQVLLSCRTRDKTAVEGKDYVGGTFAVRFRSGETTKLLRIPIIDDMSATEKEEVFEVEIADIDCEGAVIGGASKEDWRIFHNHGEGPY